ncbi:MAG: hypothetical protein NW701_06845 [Nitrospira sp.]
MCQMRRFTKKVLTLGLACSLSACGAYEMWRCAPDGEDKPFVGILETCLNNDDDGFKSNSVGHPVYCLPGDRTKPPVLLLHELPGLSGKTLAYAKDLSQDFTVYVPLLFGALNSHSTLRGSAAFWLNGEWWGLESGESDIVKWLRTVVGEVERQHPGQSIGVIGNCLTGSLPLALLDNQQINAVVLAQPTLPLTIFRNDKEARESLGISKDEIDQARKSSAKIYYLRFFKDCVSKCEKLKKLRDDHHFDGRFIHHVIPYSRDLVENAHSTLIGEWSDAESGKPSKDAREEVKRFLRDPEKFVQKNERSPVLCETL